MIYPDDYLNKIICGDCLEVMKEIPDNSVDMIITDPPYLINYRSNRRVVKEKFDYLQNDQNNEEMITLSMREMNRVLKPNSSIYLFCNWKRIDFFKREFEMFFKLKNIIIWKKNNHGTGDLYGSYAPIHEFILFGDKGRNLCRRKRIDDVIESAKIPSSKLLHPTEKPVALLEILIRQFSDEGNIILDPFSGSGSSLEASRILNRNFIGIDISQKYCEIARQRLANG